VRRLTGLAAAVAVLALAAASLAPARVDRGTGFGFSNGVTNSFRAQAATCIRQYLALGGLAVDIYRGVSNSHLDIALQPPANGGHQSFTILERFKPTGQLVIKVEWWPGEHGTYPLDGAPEVPCAILLHEMQHAWDMDAGTTSGMTDSFGPSTVQNPAQLREALYVEGRGVKAENFYLWHHGLRQRRHYGLFRLTTCIPHPESRGSIYLQGCYGSFILPNWVVWR